MGNEVIKDAFEWDIVNWSKALEIWEKYLPSDKTAKCIELGGRRGGLALWLASKGYNVLCSDIKTPEPRHDIMKKYDFSNKISFGEADALNISETPEYDVIAAKSMLGGIARNGNDKMKKITADSIHCSLKPGGIFLFAENLEGSKLLSVFRKKFTFWAGEWNYFKMEEVDDVFSSFSKVEYKAVGFIGAFGPNNFARNVLGKIDTVIFDKSLPDHWKYIVFGVAIK